MNAPFITQGERALQVKYIIAGAYSTLYVDANKGTYSYTLSWLFYHLFTDIDVDWYKLSM